jgi:hypothetical protein
MPGYGMPDPLLGNVALAPLKGAVTFTPALLSG